MADTITNATERLLQACFTPPVPINHGIPRVWRDKHYPARNTFLREPDKAVIYNVIIAHNQYVIKTDYHQILMRLSDPF